MTLLAVQMKEQIYLKVLPAPDTFGTTSGRAWTVNLWDCPLWARFAAVVAFWHEPFVPGRFVHHSSGAKPCRIVFSQSDRGSTKCSR